jgi:threonine dehydrogenase-like Zn-dependent dehydrogenase
VFAHVAQHFRAQGRVLVLAHRGELLDQAKEKLQAWTGLTTGLEQGEASGAGPALAGALAAARPGAVVVQVGIGNGDMTVPMNMVVAKEITLRGTFRFHAEFDWAVAFLASGAIDVRPLLTEVVPVAEAVDSFQPIAL